jgi:hypothetical protein
LETDDDGCSDRCWQMAESAFPEDRGPSLNFLCSLAAAVTPEGPPHEGKRIRIEFANRHRQRSANVEPFRDPAATKSDCDCSHNKLAFTDKPKIEWELSVKCRQHWTTFNSTLKNGSRRRKNRSHFYKTLMRGIF